jgi:hypothetical protein
MTTTAEALTHTIVDHLLQRWPGGTLISEALTSVLAPSLTRCHELAQLSLRKGVPFDDVLAAALAAGKSAGGGEALGRFAGERLASILDALVTPVGTSPVGIAATGAQVQLPPPGQGPGFQPPRNWNVPEVVRALARLGRVAAYDLATVTPRLALAAVVADIAVAFPGIRSTANVGVAVHRVAQERYRNSYAPPNLVVADRRVYGGFPEQFTGQRLSEVNRRNYRLGCCYFAWLNENAGGKRQWVSNFRGDITDLGRMNQWEIKPFSEAPAGVLQEIWYRVAYNFIASSWADENPLLQGLLGTLLPGGAWEYSLCLPPIDVTKELGIPAVAIPMTIPALPGLVLYAVFSGPQAADTVALAAALYLWLLREIRRRGRELEKLVQQTEESLRAMCRWIAENWQALLILLAIVVVAVVAITGSIGTLNPAPALAGAALIIFLLSGLGGPQGPDRGPIRPEGSLLTINFPGVSITTYPHYFGRLLASGEATYSGSVATVLRGLDSSFRAA